MTGWLKWGRASGDHPSIAISYILLNTRFFGLHFCYRQYRCIHATVNDLGFQELTAALTPVCTDVEAHISVRPNAAASATMLVTRLKPCSHYVPWRHCNQARWFLQRHSHTLRLRTSTDATRHTNLFVPACCIALPSVVALCCVALHCTSDVINYGK